MDGWMDGWMRTSVHGSDPSLKIILWPLFPPRSHLGIGLMSSRSSNFREAMQSTRKILAGAAGLTTAFVAEGFAKFNQVNILLFPQQLQWFYFW